MAPESVVTLVAGVLDAERRRQVLDLAERAQAADGAAPLNESAFLDVRALEPTDGIAHQLALRGDDLVGYCHLDSTSGDSIAQLVVSPDSRRKGIASQIIGDLGFDPRSEEGGVRLRQGLHLRTWSFGNLPSAQGLAEALGYLPVRELLIMERGLTDLPAVELPEGTTLRPFTEADIPEVLRVNSRAFAHHPEQGAMTESDVRTRMAEPWFDPEGFLLATRPDTDGTERVVGFHWTKRHDQHTGEVYVIAVDPDHAAGGLGRQLLYAGLAHLADRGAERVILYCEGDLDYVVKFYLSARFDVANRDLMYASPPQE